jgi:hypothetical protein
MTSWPSHWTQKRPQHVTLEIQVPARPIRLSTILAVMSVSTFKTADFHIYIVLDKKSRSKGIRHAFILIQENIITIMMSWKAMVNNSANINKTYNDLLTFSLNTKKTTTCDIGNPGAVMSVSTFKTADFHIYIVLDKKSRSKGIRHAFFQHLEINYIDFDQLLNSFHGYLLKTY